MSKADKPIDLDRRRDVLKRMAALEREFKELRKQVAGPEQLAQRVLAELERSKTGFGGLAEAFFRCELWVLHQMVLWGVYLKVQGHDPDPTDALALFTKNTEFGKESFRAAVLAKLAEIEDELVK